jgi:hypothetical protein
MRGGARPRGNSTATCPSPDVRVTYNKHTTATHILVATCRTTLQRAVLRCNVPHYVATCRTTLQRAVDCCTLLRGPGCPIRTALSGQTRTPMRCSSSHYNRLGWRHTIGQVAALTAFARSSEARTGAALPRRRPRRGTWRTRATPVVLDGAVWHGTTYSVLGSTVTHLVEGLSGEIVGAAELAHRSTSAAGPSAHTHSHTRSHYAHRSISAVSPCASQYMLHHSTPCCTAHQQCSTPCCSTVHHVAALVPCEPMQLVPASLAREK